MGGITAGAPSTPAALAPVEKPAKAPDAVNEVTPGSQPAAQAPPANGKAPKPTFDKGEESSSKHKKKKGLGKLNPF
jgi:outer membrane protein assembly factor BamD